MDNNDFGFDITNLRAYAGYLINPEKLKASASGGAATALAESILSDGGVVFGATYSNDFKSAEYALIEDIADLYKIKSSKYISAKKEVLIDGKYVSVYKLLQEKLSLGKKVLFIGLGCDVGAVIKHCETSGIDMTNLYTIDLICHGTTLSEVAIQYIDYLEKKHKSKIVNFNVRYKKNAWIPPYLRAEFESGKIYEAPFYDTDYGKAFDKFSRTACYNCKFKGENHQSDITIGDYWGMDKNSKAYNKNGVSIIFINKKKGYELIEKLNDNEFCLTETDVKTSLQSNKNYYTCRNKALDYEKFTENLKTKDLHYAVSHTYSFFGRIKRAVKGTVKKFLRG